MIDTIYINKLAEEAENSNRILNEEEAKLKALEILENYFDIKLYLTEVNCHISYSEPNRVEQYIGEAFMQKATTFDNAKSVLEYGKYEIYFSLLDDYKETEYYILELEAKTGNLILYYHYFNDSNYQNNVSDEASVIKLLYEFVEKTNIANIEDIKVTSHEVNKNNIHFFEIEDEDNANSKGRLAVNGNTEKIIRVLIGYETLR